MHAYKAISKAPIVPRNTMSSIIVKWKETQQDSQRSPSGQREYLGKKGIKQGGDQYPNGGPNRASVAQRDENLLKGQPSPQHSINQACMIEWLDRSHCEYKA